MEVALKLEDQISMYLGQMDNKQKKAVLGVVKAIVGTKTETDIWKHYCPTKVIL